LNTISATIPVGVVVRRTPGITKWAFFNWRAVAVIPSAPSADWREMRRDGDAVEFHAGTLPLTLHRAETEAYLTGLSVDVPKLYVVMRHPEEPQPDQPLELALLTASPFEAQDYCDNGEDIVEPVPMAEALIAWIAEFVTRHHHEEVFVKRKRDKLLVDRVQDGIGDPRIRQVADVYRAPGAQRREEAP